LAPAVVALRQSAVVSALKSDAFDQLPWPSLCLNASGQILTANQAFANIVQRPLSEITGRALSEVISRPRPRVLTRRWSRLWLQLLVRQTLKQRVHATTVSGRRLALDLAATLHQAENEPVAVIALREASEQREARHGARAAIRHAAALRERADRLQLRLRALAEHAADLTMLLDRDGTVLYQAPSVLRSLGLDPQQTLGRPAAALLVEDDQARLGDEIRIALDSGQASRRRGCLVHARRGDGGRCTLWLSISNRLDDPALGGLLVTGIDVGALVAQAAAHGRPARRGDLRERLLQLALKARGEFPQLLSGVLRAGADSLQAGAVSYWRVAPGSGALVCESLYSRAEQRFVGDWSGVEFPATGVVEPPARLRAAAPLVLEDTQSAAPGGTDAEAAAQRPARELRWQPVRALLSAPVVIGGQVIGALMAFEASPRRWDEEEIGFIATAALIMALATEISQRQDAENRVEHLAWYDPLTALPNRNLLRENLRDAIVSASASGRRRRIAVLLIDLDRFKDVNDTLGHLVGDALIKSAAQVLKEAVGPGCTVARLGGDEFVVVVEDFAHREEIALLAARMAQALHRSDLVPKVDTQVSASIGVALYPEHGREVSTLLKNADAAMYQAKRDGRNQVSFFNPIRHERATREVQLGIELMKAIQGEAAQFCLEYQPVVAMADSRVVGLEALIRWNHPVRGVLPPESFVGVAEVSGLSDHLTRWVVNEVCTQILRWRQVRPGFDIPVSINVAGRELGSNALPILVRSALNRYAIAPSLIVLEITERTLVTEGQVNNDVIAELASLGVGLVLDDFGTGFSTLGYLKRMPIQALKIDSSFIKGIPHDPDSRALVLAMLAVARHFKLKVVAEGIENSEQVEYLRALGCEQAQGYFYSRPLPSATIIEYLERSGGVKPVAPSPLPG
jgi:diguanylate cyclase (GGDEF)-like protein/PAS domain S-box-containing protein